MNTKYRYKPLPFDAVQFHCTPEGIAAIAVFGGTDFTGINSQRVNGTPAAAYVDGLVVPEGSWLLRNSSGMYKVLKDSVFQAVCEPAIEAAPAEVKLELSKAEQEQLNYEAALASGAKRYASVRPCFRGHVTERYTNGKGCATCIAEASTRNRSKRIKAAARQDAATTRKALRACTGPFAPLAASLSQNMAR